MGRERWRAASDAAQVIANYLRCHPRVSAVRYPGLKSDPLFGQAATCLVGGFGPTVWYCVDGTWSSLTCSEGDPKALIMQMENELRAR